MFPPVSTADILFTPGPEQRTTTNAWALLQLLRPGLGIAGADWVALRQAIADDPEHAATVFAGLVGRLSALGRLMLPRGPEPALVLRSAESPGRVFSRDALASPAGGLPAPLAAALARPRDRTWLLQRFADLLLYADLRPDDRVLLAGLAPDAWLPLLAEGMFLVLATTTPAGLLALAAEFGATVLVAPASWIDEAAVRRAGRPDLRGLRSLIAIGGPMAPAARARLYAWVKPDVMLLAQAGRRYWGDPLAPVRAHPVAERGLFRLPGSAPAA